MSLAITDPWAAANIDLRRRRDEMDDIKRREAVAARKVDQQRAAAAAMLADPEGAALCRAGLDTSADAPMHAWFIDSVGRVYRVTLH